MFTSVWKIKSCWSERMGKAKKAHDNEDSSWNYHSISRVSVHRSRMQQIYRERRCHAERKRALECFRVQCACSIHGILNAQNAFSVELTASIQYIAVLYCCICTFCLNLNLFTSAALSFFVVPSVSRFLPTLFCLSPVLFLSHHSLGVFTSLLLLMTFISCTSVGFMLLLP